MTATAVKRREMTKHICKTKYRHTSVRLVPEFASILKLAGWKPAVQQRQLNIASAAILSQS